MTQSIPVPFVSFLDFHTHRSFRFGDFMKSSSIDSIDVICQDFALFARLNSGSLRHWAMFF